MSLSAGTVENEQTPFKQKPAAIRPNIIDVEDLFAKLHELRPDSHDENERATSVTRLHSTGQSTPKSSREVTPPSPDPKDP
ncbi:MAG: hypothetical protein GOMPHAMPRED_000135 [Gomphillus americanus]|uniref:Uncharacterized protein n=1 Tax=Gomphillus americanus TaxID=1940652 RepID=A0A8H3EDM0_9LECA|nr:MAG: hypothetical protein GOMPHAMPRED_000135 [Gomphillus americanus]